MVITAVIVMAEEEYFYLFFFNPSFICKLYEYIQQMVWG
jgi:hypothetical protein